MENGYWTAVLFNEMENPFLGPHRPSASDLKEKISNIRMNGGLAISFDKENPTFDGFDDPSLTQSTRQALSESQVPTDRIDELLAFYNDPVFQEKVDGGPYTGRLLISTVSHSNETLTGTSIPNGNFASAEAIERAIEACNTFLDDRPADRNFIIDYYGVEFQ